MRRDALSSRLTRHPEGKKAMRKRRRTCTTIYLGSNDKRFEYVTDGNVKLADSVTIERWVVRLMACTKAWMRLDADGMRTIHGTRIEGLLNIELQWLAELTKARTIESEAFSVDDDDDDDVAKDLIELIVNKPVIRIGQNEEAKVNVVVGNGNYTVRSFNTAIATATVSGELITVKSGSQNGATTVEVMDGEGVVANISVNVGVFELEVNEPEVILEVAGEKQLIVSMGNFSSNDELSYEVEDETVVSMVNTDQFRPFYTLTGLKNGHTTVTFTDHKGKQAVVQVTVNPISIDVSNLTPRVGVNNKIMITVEKGNGGYSLTAEDEEIVAIQQVDDTRFNLIGKKAGITTVFVRDEAEQELSLTVTVVQADKVANLGSGNYFKVPFEYNGTADESLKNLSTITFEARFNIESLNGNDNGNARINTVMGIEKKFLLRVDVHKGGSNDEERFLQLAADDKGSIRYEGSTKIETNKWYDVAVVLDNSKSGSERIALYVNGVRETLQLSNGTPDDLKEINLTSDFYIGQSDGKRRLNGAISYARIWTKALSDQQISEQSGKLLSEDKDGMVANWLFNNGNGNTKTFVSLAGKSFEAEAANIVSSWKTDPILETSAPTE